MNEARSGSAGSSLLASLRAFVASALELAQVRLELLGTELEAQKLRILAGLIWAALGVMLVGLGLVLFIGCVVMMFWDGYRLQAMGILTFAFLVGGALVLRHASAQLKTLPGAFAASVAELTQDRDALARRPDA